MKTLITLLLFAALNSRAQTWYVSLSSTNFSPGPFYPVKTNYLVTWIGNSNTGGGANGYCDQGVIGLVLNQTQTGLTNISISAGGSVGAPHVSSFSITCPAAPAASVSNYLPADAIVIPASATGPVQIILESSPDLVNWTAASPGTYGPSAATNRFFRVRAIAQ